MTDKKLDEKSDDLMRLFFNFCDDAELNKYIDEEEGLTESGKYLLFSIKKWLKVNIIREDRR